MTQFFFLAPGENLDPPLAAADVIGVPISSPPSAPSAGYAWLIGSPEAVQVNGAWQQNWVQEPIPLATAQAQAIATVATTLTARISAGFSYNGVLVACDEASQGKIDRVANMAENIIAGRSTVTWTSRTWPPFALGNPGVPLPTAQDMVTFGTAIGDYVADNEFHAADLTAQIMASTATAASIAALDLDNSKGTWPTS